MQFYLIFPLIAILRNHLAIGKYQGLLVSILAGSLIYQVTTTNKIIAYESLFCRIWQFAYGILAQSLPVINIQPQIYVTHILILLIITVLICPFTLPTIFISFTVLTVVAVVVIFSSQNDPFKNLTKISGRTLSLIISLGDISYILYLIHWPLLTYIRFSSVSRRSGFNFYGTVFGYKSTGGHGVTISVVG